MGFNKKYYESTQDRRDENYDARMNWWNQSMIPLFGEGMGCIIAFGAFILLTFFIGLLITIFDKL